jgi:hypothetical protein
LALDSFKTTVVRSSSSILDLLGDLGGFYGSIGILVFLFGEYFSEKFYLQAISNSLYVRKKTKDEFLRRNDRKKEQNEKFS